MALNFSIISSFSLGISVPSAFKKRFSRNFLFSFLMIVWCSAFFHQLLSIMSKMFLGWPTPAGE
jgi:uncharacterized membrane protein YfhO